MREAEPEGDTPGLIARPPSIYLCSILIGLGLDALWPVAMLPPAWSLRLGGPLVVIACVLFAVSVREFRRANTPLRSVRPATAVVTSGPYRLSRNPIYLAFSIFHAGIAFWVNSSWLLGMLILTLILISYCVIAREERYLVRRFGDEYATYRSTVRRWL